VSGVQVMVATVHGGADGYGIATLLQCLSGMVVGLAAPPPPARRFGGCTKRKEGPCDASSPDLQPS
jgi:hypothetical protein